MIEYLQMKANGGGLIACRLQHLAPIPHHTAMLLETASRQLSDADTVTNTVWGPQSVSDRVYQVSRWCVCVCGWWVGASVFLPFPGLFLACLFIRAFLLL